MQKSDSLKEHLHDCDIMFCWLTQLESSFEFALWYHNVEYGEREFKIRQEVHSPWRIPVILVAIRNIMTYLPALRCIWSNPPYFPDDAIRSLHLCMHMRKKRPVTQCCMILYRGYLHNNHWLFEEWASAHAQRNTYCDVIMFRMAQRIAIILEGKCTSCLILNFQTAPDLLFKFRTRCCRRCGRLSFLFWATACITILQKWAECTLQKGGAPNDAFLRNALKT